MFAPGLDLNSRASAKAAQPIRAGAPFFCRTRRASREPRAVILITELSAQLSTFEFQPLLLTPSHSAYPSPAENAVRSEGYKFAVAETVTGTESHPYALLSW